MKRISLVNSGESLDKAIALTDCAFKSNPGFYQSFEKVFIFYCNDLTKKKGHHASGSIKTFMDIQGQFLSDCKYTREYIIDCLVEKGFISLRLANHMQRDNSQYARLIENIPWYLVFEDERDRILGFMKSKYPNVEYINIGEAFDATQMVSVMPYYKRIGKLYLLLRDGNVKAYKLGKNDINLKKIQKTEAQSIVAGGNVYAFIILISDFMKKNIGIDTFIGYRPSSRFSRQAYDNAIQYINDHFMTKVEPKNVYYNAYFSKIKNPCDDLNFSVIMAAFSSAIEELYGK